MTVAILTTKQVIDNGFTLKFQIFKLEKNILLLQKIQLEISNYLVVVKQLMKGYTPVVQKGNQEFTNIPQYMVSHERNGYMSELTIKYKFESQEPHYFAFSHPYSYEQNQKQLVEWESKYKSHKEIYFHRECIAMSLQKRKIDMITISSYKNITEQREELILQENQTRPFIFNKQYIFFSARVHPSEIPGSHVLVGAIKAILQNQQILDHFVFQIVPMINPDGCYRGHHRVDTLGQNLNRFYQNPVRELQPSTWAIDQVIGSINKKLYMLMDFHSHSTKKGNFIHGNCLAFQQQVETALFIRLLSLNSQDFDHEGCDCSEKNMYSADAGDGLSKEGSARVTFYKKYKIQNCFTIECNYAVASKRNIRYEKKQILSSQFTNLEFQNWYDPKFQERFDKYDFQVYNIKHYDQLGRAIIDSILDINDLNKENYLASSPFRKIQFLKYYLAIKILSEAPFRYQLQFKNLKNAFQSKTEKFIQSFQILRSLFEKKDSICAKNNNNNKKQFRIQTKSANPKQLLKGLNNQMQ